MSTIAEGITSRSAIETLSKAKMAVTHLTGARSEGTIDSVESGRWSFRAIKKIVVTPRRTRTLRAGRLIWNEAGRVDTPAQAADAADEALRRYTGHAGTVDLVAPLVDQNGLGERFRQDVGKGTLVADRIVSYAHCTCDDCDGDGTVTCTGCHGASVQNCTYTRCLYGWEHCGGCGGSGQIRTGNSMSDCPRCYGQGRHRCSYCGGSQEVRCQSCTGRGNFHCRPCESTGHFTDAYGVEVVYSHESHYAIPKGASDQDKAGFLGWMRRELYGIHEKPVDGSPEGSCGFDPVPAGTQDGSYVFTTEVTGTFERSKIKGKVGDRQFVATANLFDTPSVTFEPFLDEDVAAMKERLVAAGSSGLPSKALKTMAAGVGLNDLVESVRRGDDPLLSSDQTSTRVCGAASVFRLTEVAGAYKKVVDGYARQEFVRSWKRWSVVAVLGTLAAISTDLPWALRAIVADPGLLVGGTTIMAAIPAFVAWAGAEIATRRRIAAETGKGTALPKMQLRSCAPIGVWAVCVAILGWPLVSGMGNDPIRSAATSVRQAIGYPSVGEVIRDW